MNEKESGLGAVLAVIFLLVMIVPSTIWQGYVLSLVWGWFISPTFGLPLLKIPVALGISSIFSFMSPTVSCKKEDEDDNSTAEIVLTGLIKSFGKSAIFLLFGWIIKFWM